MNPKKIAGVFGKSTYRAFRAGFTPARIDADSDADLKAALGQTQRECGVLAVQALETRYASTLAHEESLRRAWDRKLRDEAKERGTLRDPYTIAVQRMAAAVSIRRVAGARMIQHEISRYAWLVRCRREVFEQHMKECGGWLDSLWGAAQRTFLEAIKEVRAEESKRKAERRKDAA